MSTSSRHELAPGLLLAGCHEFQALVDETAPSWMSGLLFGILDTVDSLWGELAVALELPRFSCVLNKPPCCCSLNLSGLATVCAGGIHSELLLLGSGLLR